MTDEEFRQHAIIALTRIADALDRLAPEKIVHIKHPPADLDHLSAPTLADLAKWEQEDREIKDRIG